MIGNVVVTVWKNIKFTFDNLFHKQNYIINLDGVDSCSGYQRERQQYTNYNNNCEIFFQ